MSIVELMVIIMPAIEQRLEHVLDAHIELVGEILDRHALGERNRALIGGSSVVLGVGRWTVLRAAAAVADPTGATAGRG